jgi:hypothetical protein
MRSSTFLLAALAAAVFACNLENSPELLDHFVKIRTVAATDVEALSP